MIPANTDSTVTRKGNERKRQIVEAAAALLRESGPSAVTHRAVAKSAACSLSATTYYFEGLEDLLHQAGLANIARWARRAEQVAERVESLEFEEPLTKDQVLKYILAATLPDDEELEGHYLQLVAAGKSLPVSDAYCAGRSCLNAAVLRVLVRLGVNLPAELVIGVVDGAAVSAMSEGNDVRATAQELLSDLLEINYPVLKSH